MTTEDSRSVTVTPPSVDRHRSSSFSPSALTHLNPSIDCECAIPFPNSWLCLTSSGYALNCVLVRFPIIILTPVSLPIRKTMILTGVTLCSLSNRNLISHIRRSLQMAQPNISKEVISEDTKVFIQAIWGKYGIMNGCPGGHERRWPENDSPCVGNVVKLLGEIRPTRK
jgi:hypothetical protein